MADNIVKEYYVSSEDILMEKDDISSSDSEKNCPLQNIASFFQEQEKDKNYKYYWAIESGLIQLENSGFEIVKADRYPEIFKGHSYKNVDNRVQYKELILVRRNEILSEFESPWRER